MPSSKDRLMMKLIKATITVMNKDDYRMAHESTQISTKPGDIQITHYYFINFMVNVYTTQVIIM